MIVVTLTDCPPKLRGDLSKWLMEVNAGVYVGKVSARVREELWKRICENLLHGRATMVFSTNSEQGMDFYVYNTSWTPVDFDGIKLMRRPNSIMIESGQKQNRSKAAVQQMIRQKERSKARENNQGGYVIIDVETTGLNSESDEIIELAGIRIVNHEVTDKIAMLVRPERQISQAISKMTGITQDMLEEEGVSLDKAIDEFCNFIGRNPIVSHNISFDRAFLNAACLKLDRPGLKNICKDTLGLARRCVDDVADYKLKTLADYFGIIVEEQHRALADCMTTFYLYEKLNEI